MPAIVGYPYSFNDTDRVTDSFIPAQGSGYGYGGNGNDDRTMPIDHISERQPMRYTSPTATPTAPLNQRTAAQEAYDEGKTVPYFGGFPETDIPVSAITEFIYLEKISSGSDLVDQTIRTACWRAIIL